MGGDRKSAQLQGQVILKTRGSSSPFNADSQGLSLLRFWYVDLLIGTTLAQKIHAVVLIQKDVPSVARKHIHDHM